jgi:hypothetical protein
MSNGPFYPRGVYRCQILDHGLTKASTGTIQVAIKFRVIESVQPAGDVEAHYERTAFLPATDRTMEYLVPKLEALGYTRDSLKYLNLSEPNCHDMRGSDADFFCKHENDRNGELREKWDVATGGSGKPLELKPPDSREVRTLDMLFGKARKDSGAPKQRTASAPPAAGTTDEEAPDWV